MAESQVRVLHVIGSTRRGGAESRIMDLYRSMDRSRVQFDFLIHEETAVSREDREASAEELSSRRTRYDFDEEIEELGGRIYALPSLRYLRSPQAFLSYREACRRFFAAHARDYSVVQGHITSLAAFYLAAARKGGAPVTVAHARSAGKDPGIKGAVTEIFRRPLKDEHAQVRLKDGRHVPLLDERFACSPEAAQAVFGRAPARILPNAVDLARFRYDPSLRERVRAELQLSENTVIGHVGNFRYAKNHEFLLQVFRLLTQKEGMERIRLLLVGGGEGYETTKALAASMGLSDRVIFTGPQGDVNRYYQAMDVFAFPSRYEGLPGTVVEAQAAGLPCLISDRITTLVDATPLVEREGIGTEGHTKEAAEQWAADLERIMAQEAARPQERALRVDFGSLRAFDVKEQAAMLEPFYLTGVFA